MAKTLKNEAGEKMLCSWTYSDSEGVHRCSAPAKCPVCGHCSRLDEHKEHGHCPGHLGLNEHIQVA